MGFFDRFSGKKSPPPPSSPLSAPDSSPGGVLKRLVTARERLESHDLPGALAIYEEVAAAAGDRADVLVTISADLGVNGHVREIIELVAPRYDAERHGPATGINLLQAYLAVKNPDAAQHVLDILFSLKRPDLEERLYGFSNAIAEMMQTVPETGPAGAPELPKSAKVNLVSISKPIWFYGLEPMADAILPVKHPRQRKIAFAQLAILGLPNAAEMATQPEEELGQLSRALPLWLAEAFYFSTHYAPIAAIGLLEQQYALFSAEWSPENLRQLNETTAEGLDYIVTGALRKTGDEYEVLLRVWEVKKYRERKQFNARWNAATADAELLKLHEQVRLFMEWSPEKTGLPYAAPVAARAWLDGLAASISLFLADKNLLAKELLASPTVAVARAAARAPASEAASLAYLTLRNRAERVSLVARVDAALATSPLIAQAKDLAV